MATTATTASGGILAAVYTALNVAAITSTLSCGVYDEDHTPQDAAFPYLRFSIPSGIVWDTFGAAGKESTVQISVFSQYRGGIEAQNILDKAITLLQDVAHSVTGHTLAGFRLEQFGNGADEIIEGKKTIHKWAQFQVNVIET
jgi:hypothetical protein